MPLKSTKRFAAEVSQSSAAMFADATRRDATHRRKPSTRRTADAVPTQTVDTTRRRDALPTHPSADSNRRQRDVTHCRRKIDQGRPVEVHPLNCDEVSRSQRCRPVNELSFLIRTSPHSLLICLKQTELLTNRFYKPFGQLSCIYLCSFKLISFLLVVVSLLLIDTGP